MTWTIDRGPYSYRNIIKKYPLNNWGIERLQSDLEPLEYFIYEEWEDSFFYEQFVVGDFRAKIKIDRRIKDKVVINEIIEYSLPDNPPDYNIKKPKSDEFYQKGNTGKLLPI